MKLVSIFLLANIGASIFTPSWRDRQKAELLKKEQLLQLLEQNRQGIFLPHQVKGLKYHHKHQRARL